MKRSSLVFSLLPAIPSLILSSCGKGKVDVASGATYCGTTVPASPLAGPTGSANVFDVDPMLSSGNASLSPGTSNLDPYASSVTLTNLDGYGILKGSYVYTVTGLCTSNGEPDYGSYSATNDFRYSHSDQRFAETMTYHYGNLYRSELASAGALYPTPSFQMIANCDVDDNAYYSQKIVGSSLVDFVCIGHPTAYTTTTFADDSEVFVHELQHGTTGNAYSTSEDFNKLNYDEAGAINEGISDFAALMQAEPDIVSPFRSFEFSRWALGQFFSESLARGAAKCPVWTADYPTCASFNKDATGFSASAKRVSFAYPDGLGWPYAGPTLGSTLKTVFANSGGFEEIHQAAPILTGALYDAYIGVKAAYGDATLARRKMLKLLMESIKVLPKASGTDPSPVTMPGFATTLLSTMNGSLAATFSAGAKTAITNALADRGLTGIPTVADGWAGVGAGSTQHAGIFFYETTAVGVQNFRMHAGESGMVWFDVSNSSANTAAAPLLKVTISDMTGKVTFSSNRSLNPGYVSSRVAYVRYGKINGSNAVAALNDGTATQNSGMTTSYFDGSGLLGIGYDTALYVDISSSASVGFTFNFTVDVTPANLTSAASTATFPVTMQ